MKKLMRHSTVIKSNEMTTVLIGTQQRYLLLKVSPCNYPQNSVYTVFLNDWSPSCQDGDLQSLLLPCVEADLAREPPQTSTLFFHCT